MKKLLLGLLLLSSMAFVETDLLGCLNYGTACQVWSGEDCCPGMLCNSEGNDGFCN